MHDIIMALWYWPSTYSSGRAAASNNAVALRMSITVTYKLRDSPIHVAHCRQKVDMLGHLENMPYAMKQIIPVGLEPAGY